MYLIYSNKVPLYFNIIPEHIHVVVQSSIQFIKSTVVQTGLLHSCTILHTVLMGNSFASDKFQVVTHQFYKISSYTCAVFKSISDMSGRPVQS